MLWEVSFSVLNEIDEYMAWFTPDDKHLVVDGEVSTTHLHIFSYFDHLEIVKRLRFWFQVFQLPFHLNQIRKTDSNFWLFLWLKQSKTINFLTFKFNELLRFLQSVIKVNVSIVVNFAKHKELFASQSVKFERMRVLKIDILELFK